MLSKKTLTRAATLLFWGWVISALLFGAAYYSDIRDHEVERPIIHEEKFKR